jgi:hypothetical protein
MGETIEWGRKRARRSSYLREKTNRGSKYRKGGLSISGKEATNFQEFNLDPYSDPELYFSIRMSMEEALASVHKRGIEVVFRLQSGSKISRVFNLSDNIELLYDFVFLKLMG